MRSGGLLLKDLSTNDGTGTANGKAYDYNDSSCEAFSADGNNFATSSREDLLIWNTNVSGSNNEKSDASSGGRNKSRTRIINTSRPSTSPSPTARPCESSKGNQRGGNASGVAISCQRDDIPAALATTLQSIVSQLAHLTDKMELFDQRLTWQEEALAQLSGEIADQKHSSQSSTENDSKAAQTEAKVQEPTFDGENQCPNTAVE